MTVLFASATMCGAALLFVVQPMVARLLLPSYGGSAMVWSTSMLFFQALLLFGYLYVHWSTEGLGAKWQPRLHLLVLLVPLVVLPLALPHRSSPAGHGSPAIWLLWTLTLVVGLPFFVLSMTGPLMQRWYSWTSGHRSDDPYFLFAASNLGSFGGLLAYPFLIEPLLSLDEQRGLWSVGFLLYAGLMAACGIAALRFPRPPAPDATPTAESGTRPAPVRMLRWLALAFLPSALMLAVTTHVTTDVAAIPLLWVVPLAIYLATFVLAFARTARETPVGATRLAVAAGLATATASALPVGTVSAIPQVVLEMLMLGAVGYAAHARLAADRPEPARLTTYYIVIAIGGALGGLLNGLVAPLVFDRVLEYPIVMVVVPLLMLGLATDSATWLDRFAARQSAWMLLLVGLAAVGIGGLVFAQPGEISVVTWLSLVTLTGLLGYRVSHRVGFVVGLLVLVYGVPMMVDQVRALDQSRTFFGSYQTSRRGDQHVLLHGTTVHGTQYLDERADEPTTYYARSGPLGAIFSLEGFDEVGVIGLGAGTIAAYGDPVTRMTFFEIDPEMARIARDTSLFTYLARTDADVDMVIGDGRLAIEREPAGRFDLLILDAFSSDAIPIHLLTVEAMDSYARRVATGGLLAVHISSRVFDLEPVLAGAARHLGWPGAIGRGSEGAGASATLWVVLSPDSARIASLARAEDWRELGDETVTWTDNFSSILDVLR